MDTINNVSALTISTTEDGLFSLNDLHKMSGGEDKNSPRHFLRNKIIKELCAAIERQNGGIPPFRKTSGVKGGTFACKELVYAYAMWISPLFHLAVIKAFDEHQQLKSANVFAMVKSESKRELEQFKTEKEKEIAELKAKQTLPQLSTAQYSGYTFTVDSKNKKCKDIIDCYQELLSTMPEALSYIKNQIERMLCEIQTHQSVLDKLKK
ncbi:MULTISPECIES: KilA-N domain-containing protein [Cysteiniphilum]|uniref:KilA-N domain-containing protein n=1 Tax=Cysteiniphilum TaxID=2056696 RepID=UPI0017860A36|nr:KilA-N domain-containing protein [Cysteiniphilum sp. 19X3-34]